MYKVHLILNYIQQFTYLLGHSSRLNAGPQRYTCVLFPRTYSYDIISKKYFMDVIKDLERRSSWIIQICLNTSLTNVLIRQSLEQWGHSHQKL